MANKSNDKRELIPQIMPNNIEAELAVLGCALLSEDASLGIIGLLDVKDFYSEVNQKVFGAMLSLYDRNLQIDYVSVTDELTKTNQIDAVGGSAFIISLTNGVPSAARWAQYADIVKRCSVNRSLIKSCDRVLAKAYNGDDDSLGEAEKNIFALSEKGQVSSLDHISPYLDIVMDKFREINKSGGQVQGIPSGFYAIDEITRGWQKSDLILIAARPAVGKTALTMNFIVNAALKKKKCAVFSLEMSKAQLVQRIICSVAGVDMGSALSGKLQPNDWTKLFNAMKTLKECDIFIDDSTLNTPAQIISKCRKLKREKGLDLIMIDYLQLMYSDKKTDNRQTEVADMSRQMKVLAKELDVPVLLLSQLSRAVESRTGKKPVLSDLRESGSIEQDADIVMFIHKPEEMQGVEHKDQAIDYVAEIIFAKNRSGKIGSVFIGWKGSRVSFVNLPKDQDAQSLMESAPPESKRIETPSRVESADFDEVFVAPELVDEFNDAPPFDMEAPPEIPNDMPAFDDDFGSVEQTKPVNDDPNGDIFD